MFPAWRAFAEQTHLTAWRTLQSDGQALLGQMGWGKSHLPSDWVAAAGGWQDAASQRVAAADEFRYDPYPAVSLVGRSAQRLARAPWKAWMQSYPRLQAPAWINVSTNEVAPWYMAGGLLAVRDLTLGEPQESAAD
ncbi:glycosyl hydrolase family 8 [Klebsiella pneumoniae]|nr:glycosyl hydrolase family 8 [Klebsiella pneumoniae]